jgi:Gpi18-like mannosyltransferase
MKTDPSVRNIILIWLAKLLALPLQLFPMTPISRSTLAAVGVSLLGALGAMLALYSMTRGALGEEGGVRAAFYLLIFPSGFFLAQVYTEGLFIGLTFGALACLLVRKWGWAALLAALATWTRPGGVLLLLPMAMVWIKDRAWQGDWKSVLARGLAALSPALSYGLWRLTPLADRFFLIEKLYFSRGLLAIDQSLAAWSQALTAFSMDNPQAMVYYALEFAAILLALGTCLLLFKRSPEISIFGLAMIVFALTSGAAQGMVRYVLVAPALFWVLADWGRRPAVDRVWSLASILLMGMEAMLFSFDFWVA